MHEGRCPFGHATQVIRTVHIPLLVVEHEIVVDVGHGKAEADALENIVGFPDQIHRPDWLCRGRKFDFGQGLINFARTRQRPDRRGRQRSLKRTLGGRCRPGGRTGCARTTGKNEGKAAEDDANGSPERRFMLRHPYPVRQHEVADA